MSTPDIGQKYRLLLLQECTDSGDAYTTMEAARRHPIESPVLAILCPQCSFGGAILDVLVQQGVLSQADVQQALKERAADGRPECVTAALHSCILRAMMEGTGNTHILQLLDDFARDGTLQPAMIAAADSITVWGYDPDLIRKPRPADLERARRAERARRHGR